MMTGWFKDTDGGVYYLWPYSDGSRGRMVTGWQWIDRDGDRREECYFFHTESDGTKADAEGTVTPDGYEVNQTAHGQQAGSFRQEKRRRSRQGEERER